jgi:hypothetical protein
MERSWRHRLDLLGFLLLLACYGWFSRAPAQPVARANYLCAPVGSLARIAERLREALSDQDLVIPPEQAAAPDLALDCARIVLRLGAEES